MRIVNDDSVVEFVAIELLETSLESAWVTGIMDDMQVIVVGQRFADIGKSVIAKDVSEMVDADVAVEAILNSDGN